MLPPALLALLEPWELQALLAEADSVDDAGLRRWRRLCEYGEGLSAGHPAVASFWEALALMDGPKRAQVASPEHFLLIFISQHERPCGGCSVGAIRYDFSYCDA